MVQPHHDFEHRVGAFADVVLPLLGHERRRRVLSAQGCASFDQSSKQETLAHTWGFTILLFVAGRPTELQDIGDCDQDAIWVIE